MTRATLGLALLALTGGVATGVPALRSVSAFPADQAAGRDTSASPLPSGVQTARAGAAGTQEQGYPFTDWDGRFVFVRIYFDADQGGDGGGRGLGGGFGRRGRGGGGCFREPCWHHDYPTAETNLTALLNEITDTRAYVGGNVIRASDPQLHRFPLAWLAEPGHWTPDEKEVTNLRSYLLKGGFIIFDDFGDADAPEVEHLVEQLQRIVPELRPILLDGSEPIFHSFFDIAPENLLLHGYRARFLDEQYYGYFEDNDRSKRQLAILNANNDVGEFIEYNETGFSVVNMTNEAYKLAVNYIVYALTH